MNIPNLPTDNLYKFIAIFGLIIFIFSFYIEYELTQSIITRTNQGWEVYENHSKKIDEIESNTEQTIQKNKKRQEAFEKFTRKLYDQNRLKEDKIESLRTDSIERQWKKKFDQIFSNLEFIVKMKKKEEKYMFRAFNLNNDFLVDYDRTNLEYMRYSRLFSCFLMIFGFGMWYWKFQRFIDSDMETKSKNNFNESD